MNTCHWASPLGGGHTGDQHRVDVHGSGRPLWILTQVAESRPSPLGRGAQPRRSSGEEGTIVLAVAQETATHVI